MLYLSKREKADGCQSEDEGYRIAAEQADEASDSGECHASDKKAVLGFTTEGIRLDEVWYNLVSKLTLQLPVLVELFVGIL
ncbi:Uncharacterised protein [Chlamydia trachomatis]|nr:Uncharacterised protein [Chlamydia trachomatis]